MNIPNDLSYHALTIRTVLRAWAVLAIIGTALYAGSAPWLGLSLHEALSGWLHGMGVYAMIGGPFALVALAYLVEEIDDVYRQTTEDTESRPR